MICHVNEQMGAALLKPTHVTVTAQQTSETMKARHCAVS